MVLGFCNGSMTGFGRGSSFTFLGFESKTI
jgi:hypothetical protein